MTLAPYIDSAAGWQGSRAVLFTKKDLVAAAVSFPARWARFLSAHRRKAGGVPRFAAFSLRALQGIREEEEFS